MIGKEREESLGGKSKKGSDSVKDPYEGNSFFFRPESKRNKS